MSELFDPKHRKEATTGVAAIALHGLLSGGVPPGGTPIQAVDSAFRIAEEFMKRAEALPA